MSAPRRKKHAWSVILAQKPWLESLQAYKPQELTHYYYFAYLDVALECPLSLHISATSELIREVYLYSGQRLMQKLITGQSPEIKYLWSAQPSMGH